MKKTNELMRRVRKSEKAIARLPEWARNGCRWQGGGGTLNERAKEQQP